ncbi:MAG: signal transduction histidine kinase [Myxococcota bacterium]|jgi:signal transduction histidine kinase
MLPGRPLIFGNLLDFCANPSSLVTISFLLTDNTTMDLSSLRNIVARAGRVMVTEDTATHLADAVPFVQESDSALAGEIYILLAERYAFSGFPERAELFIKDGLRNASLEETPELWLRLHLARGASAYERGNLVQSMAALTTVRTQAHAIGRGDHEVRASVGMGLCLVRLGDPKTALEVLDQCARATGLIPPRVIVALQRTRLLALLQARDRVGARHLCDTVDMSHASDRDLSLHNVLVARLLLEEGHADKAQVLALSIKRIHLVMSWETTDLRMTLAKCCFQLGDSDQALVHLNAIHANQSSNAVRSLLAEAWRLKGRIYANQGDLTAMWDALDAGDRETENASVGVMGRALHAIIQPLSDELDNRNKDLADANAALKETVATISKANARLAVEVERHEVTQRTLHNTHQDLVRAAHTAGMAEVATGLLHDLGNTLNSVGVSVGMVRENMGCDLADRIERLADAGIANPIEPQRMGDYLRHLGMRHRADQFEVDGELERVQRGIAHIAKTIAAQQRNAAQPRGLEEVVVRELVNDAVELALGLNARVCCVVDVPEVLRLVAAPHRVVRILVNLLQNARDALGQQKEPKIEVHVDTSHAERIALVVVDNGTGVPTQDRDRIFAHGYTTKTTGFGFGLHASATAAIEMGGKLILSPQQPGEGARFTLILPRSPSGVRLDLLYVP